MFRVTPVPENRERKVSFSPDIDESYRHQVVDKIKTLMDEVSVGSYLNSCAVYLRSKLSIPTPYQTKKRKSILFLP